MFTLSKRSIDLTGQTFGYWTAEKPVGKTKHGSVVWLCRCRCGTVRDVDGQSLRKGISTSCRCGSLGINMTHGETTSRKPSVEYTAYHTARARCQKPDHPRYQDWGGRGIEFRFQSFAEFLECVGRKPNPAYSLNRIDNDGHYEQGNVEWADATTQSRNRRNVTPITVGNRTHTITEWAIISDLNLCTINSRLHLYDWCPQCAVTLPVKEGTRQCIHLRDKS